MQTIYSQGRYTSDCPYCDYVAVSSTYLGMNETFSEHISLEHLDGLLEGTENLVTLIREALVARFFPYSVADAQARKALETYRNKHFTAGLGEAHRATREAIEEADLA